LKKKVKLIAILLFLVNVLFAESILLYQKHLEETVQSALDKILGTGKSIVYISLTAEEEKWEINYTKIPEIDGMNETMSVRKQSTIVPGIPSLRFLTEGSDSNSSMPLNYEVVQKPPKVKNKDITLILDKSIRLGDLRRVKLFVTKFLNIDEKQGDKITILKEKFSSKEKASLSKQKVTSKKRTTTMTIVFISLAVILAIAVVFVLYRFIVGTGKSKSGAGDGATMMMKEPEPEEEHVKTEDELKDDEDEERKLAEEELIKDMNKDILGNGSRYFNFIDENNIYKLKFLLQVKIALKKATPKTVAVVMSCLPFKLSASILVEYPLKIQGEIANNLLVLQHYAEKDLSILETDIMESIEYLFGGKQRLKLILEKITGEDKRSILKIIEEKYPGIAGELSSLIVLYDDMLNLDEHVLGRIFGDIDTEDIATSLVHIDPTQQRKVLNTLPKGVQAMVDQWLNLKSNTASRFDVDQARQKIINYAQHLEKEGFITLGND